MTESRIEGFVAGSTALTVSNVGVGVSIAMTSRGLASSIEAVFSVEQSRRLRRLLAAAEKRTMEGRP